VKGGDDRQRLKDLLIRYRVDAVAFVVQVLQAKPTKQQAMILRAIVEPGARVSLRSGHGVGKTSLLAWIILWQLCLWPHDTRIGCLAPTAHQLYDELWAEIAKWKGQMIQAFAQMLNVHSDRVVVVGREKTSWAAARTARPENPEALQGLHCQNMMILVDESSGVHEKIFEVGEGALTTEGARIILTGNPTRTDGYFYRSHTSDRAHWKTFVFSAVDSELVSKEWVKQMGDRYGKDSDVYRVRVKGEFPKGSADTLIPLELVEAAIGRDIKTETSKRIAGLDVARFGDDANALVIRQGGMLTHVEQWYKQDTMVTTGRAVGAFRRKKLFDRIHVDEIGMGAGVVDRLKELGIPVLGVNVGESAPERDEYMRYRDQLWWAVKEWFEARTCRIDPKLDRDLVNLLVAELTGIKYTYTSSGKIKVQGKREFKEDGIIVFDGLKRSPNIGDALMLTFAEGVVTGGKGTAEIKTEDYPW